jgi:hypothetical protein
MPISQDELALLPRWAFVALLARFGRQLLPLYEHDEFEPEEQRVAVRQAIALAELRARMGGPADEEMTHSYEIGTQYYDNYDLVALHASLLAGRNAALNTYADIGNDAEIPLMMFILALIAFEAACLDGIRDQNEYLAATCELLETAAGVSEITRANMVSDYGRLVSWLRRDDKTGVAAAVFGGDWLLGAGCD